MTNGSPTTPAGAVILAPGETPVLPVLITETRTYSALVTPPWPDAAHFEAAADVEEDANLAGSLSEQYGMDAETLYTVLPLTDPEDIPEGHDRDQLRAALHTARGTTPTPVVRIVSFGYLHDLPPQAHLTVDLRVHFRDPHLRPELRELTAHDERVRQVVMGTPGIAELLVATVEAIDAYSSGPNHADITVAVGCAGGRHRAPVVAGALAAILAGDTAAAGLHGLAHMTAWRPRQRVELTHRDLDKPVVGRTHEAANHMSASSR
jgi:UPF0042 nucleotide-binding protein